MWDVPAADLDNWEPLSELHFLCKGYRSLPTCMRLWRTQDLTLCYSVCLFCLFYLLRAALMMFLSTTLHRVKVGRQGQHIWTHLMERWGCIWCTSCDLSDQIDRKCILNASRRMATALEPIKQWESANAHWGVSIRDIWYDNNQAHAIFLKWWESQIWI